MRTLLFLTLSGSVLALLLLALRYVFLRRMPSTVYYYAWLLVLLRFILPLPGLVPAGTAPASVPEPAAELRLPRAEADMSSGLDVIQAVSAPERAGRPVVRADAQSEPAAAQPREPSPAPVKRSVDWKAPGLWLGLWAAGALISFLFYLLAYLRFVAGLRRTLDKPDLFVRRVYASLPGRRPALFRSVAVRTPLMYGVFSPRIVLPARDYDEELLRNILLHELTHFRRLDPLYKWFSVAVLSAQWFNPLSWLIRRELSRACELSCDETLLRSMTRAEKQAYGNTLLSMAVSGALPAGVVATTFATEKKNLKERLEQIMNYKRSGARVLAAVLALALLAGCGAAAGPASGALSSPDPDTVRVTTVDELLAAIAPDAVIELAAGEYDLSTASDYGTDPDNGYYVWSRGYDEGYELEIRGVRNLTLRGEGMDKTTISAVPRYANVLHFSGCRNLTLSALTAGHTKEPGFCSGGVLYLDGCDSVTVEDCGLFGCGTVGVQARDCTDLTVTGSHIYECSLEAVSVRSCRNVRVENCDVYRHGTREGQGSAMSLFEAGYTDGFTVFDNRIYESRANILLHANYSKDVLFLSNDVHDNRFDTSVFVFEQYRAVVDGCRFADNDFRHWVPDHRFDPIDVEGKPLDGDALAAMTLRRLDPTVAVTPVPAAQAAEVARGGSIEVTTVDELLAAIGPDRSIVLNAALFDLSTASDYGAAGGEYYYWQESYDGPQLVISGVRGLTICAAADDPKATTLAAIPRYADVLSFRSCDDIRLIGFTAGHTKEPGSCSGGVLNFQDCSEISIESCRLYGCGILGIQTSHCAAVTLRDTEIYECSQGAGIFFQTDGLSFLNCDVHDVPSPAFQLRASNNMIWNGEYVTSIQSYFDVGEDGALTPVVSEREEVEYTGAVEDLANPFAGEPERSYEPDSPQAKFAAAVQTCFAERDWEALADRTAFPIQLFVDGSSFVVHDRYEFLDAVRDENFMRSVFNDDFCELIATASLRLFGHCVFGETCLDHHIAFACYGDEIREDNLYINAVSTVTPLWPGRADGPYAYAVPPTPAG